MSDSDLMTLVATGIGILAGLITWLLCKIPIVKKNLATGDVFLICLFVFGIVMFASIVILVPLPTQIPNSNFDGFTIDW